MNVLEKRPEWTDEQIALRNLSAPIRDVMRFTLVYQGPLSASGNAKSTRKHREVLDIRRKLGTQLSNLWDTSAPLRKVKEEAWLGPYDDEPQWHRPAGGSVRQVGKRILTPQERHEQFPEDDLVFMAGRIPVFDKAYTPLIRASLNLACELDILFLRQEDPGALVTQGGDLDNRIKTLLDALRMPTEAEQERAPPDEDHMFCLLENDSLVSALDVGTDRLLLPKTTYPNEVHLVIDVSVRVLEVNRMNVFLL